MTSKEMSYSDLYTERLLEVVNDPSPYAMDGLITYGQHLVVCTRFAYAGLMLGLAVKLEMGIEPGTKRT